VSLLLVLLALAVPAHASPATTAAAKVTVPRTVGRLAPDAEKRLKAAGLRYRAVRIRSLQQVGTVVASRPVAGRHVARGTRVLIRISRGPGP
jgi:beta-lactam-binding protein with PASTA domain